MRRCFWMLMVAWLMALPLSAQDDPATTPKPDKMASTQAVVARELEAANKAIEAASEDDAKPPQALLRIVELLEQTQVTLSQISSMYEQREQILTTKAELSVKQERVIAGETDEKPPYTFLLLDSLRDELNAQKAKQETVEAKLKAVEANLAQSLTDKDQANDAWIEAKEKLSKNDDASKQAHLGSLLRLAELSSRLADHVHEQRQLEAEYETISQEVDELHLDYLEVKISLIAASATFTEKDKKKQKLEIEEKIEALNRTLEQDEEELGYDMGLHHDLKHQLARIAQPDPRLNEETEAANTRQLWRKAKIKQILGQITRLGVLQEIWKKRFELAWSSQDRTKLNQWHADTETTIEGLGRAEVLASGDVDDLRLQLVTIEGKLGDVDEARADITHWLKQQRKHVRLHIKVFERELTSIEEQRRVASKLLEDIESKLGGFSFQGLVGDAWKIVSDLWNYKIKFGEKEKPTIISVGRIVAGVVLIFFGFFLSRLISRLIGRFLRKRARLNSDAAMAMQSVLFYVMLLVFSLIALNLAHVPLTVFTLLGGGLAIGIGFGAQNIINNFISGWVLIAERPVRIGDLVEVDGITGHVQSVGARCTRIRRPDGIDLLVPNSLMLERNLVNWTLSDTHIRTSVRVGVIYGSPTGQVARLIMRVVTRCSLVLAHPKPILIFDDFGDSSLDFEVYFWVHATKEMDLLEARSAIRFEIDEVFRAAGIVIAFPQRDVHLDTSTPLDVRMVEPQLPDEQEHAGFRHQAEREALLREVELFRSLDSKEIDRLASGLIERHFEADEHVVMQGDEGSSLFILVKGLLEVKVHTEVREQSVGQFIPGEFFGEMSLLTGDPRAASVIAVTESTVYELSHEIFSPLLKSRPDVSNMLCHAVAARKKKTGKTIAKAETYPDVDDASFVSEMRRRINEFFGLDP